MPYTVTLQTAAPTPLLVVRRRATQPQLSKVIPEACGVVWEVIRRLQIPSPGRNVAVYLSGQTEFDLEIGVEVAAGTAGDGETYLSATPAGKAAAATHIGPYSQLKGAHDAVHEWCRANGHQLAGPSCEVYGHWSDDPAKVRTDIFYLLK